MSEIWKDIIGYEGIYQISDHGNVRLTKGNHKSPKGKILRHCVNGNGYHSVKLCKNGTIIRFSIHRLVLRAFAGEGRTGDQARHLDGNQDNNCLSNLAWGTPHQNAQDRKRHDTQLYGEDIGISRLNANLVVRIRMLLEKPELDYQDIGEMFCVTGAAVRAIATGKTWRHVQ